MDWVFDRQIGLIKGGTRPTAPAHDGKRAVNALRATIVGNWREPIWGFSVYGYEQKQRAIAMNVRYEGLTAHSPRESKGGDIPVCIHRG